MDDTRVAEQTAIQPPCALNRLAGAGIFSWKLPEANAAPEAFTTSLPATPFKRTKYSVSAASPATHTRSDATVRETCKLVVAGSTAGAASGLEYL